MSNDPPSISLPSSRGGNTLGSNKLVSPQLTQQQLREQRLARFGGEGGGDNDNVNNSLQSQAQAQPHSIKLLPTNSPSHLPMTTTMTTNASANNEKQKLANNDNAATSEIIKQDPEEEKEEKEKELSTGNAFGRSASSTADLTEDEDLQAALALSLGLPMDVEDDDQNNDVIMSNDEPNNPASAIASADGGKIIRNDPQYFSGRVRTWYETASPCNNLAFHHCMWDAGVTTGNDKKRWISQGIRFKEEYDDNKSARTSSLLTAIISSPAGKSNVWIDRRIRIQRKYLLSFVRLESSCSCVRFCNCFMLSFFVRLITNIFLLFVAQYVTIKSCPNAYILKNAISLLVLVPSVEYCCTYVYFLILSYLVSFLKNESS